MLRPSQAQQVHFKLNARRRKVGSYTRVKLVNLDGKQTEGFDASWHEARVFAGRFPVRKPVPRAIKSHHLVTRASHPCASPVTRTGGRI